MLNNNARRRVTQCLAHAAMHVLVDFARFSVQSGPLYHMTPCVRPTQESTAGPCVGSDEDVTSVLVYWFVQQPKEFFTVCEWDGCFSAHGRACILLSHLNLQFY